MPELNPEQAQASEHGEGPLLVVAGPGTGKTRVITQRIVYLLQNAAGASEGPRLQPQNILALTFTEKAAGEMKHRVSKALPGLETAPAISTFHAFCYQTLRKHHEDRLLLDKIDVWIFLRRRMAELGLEFYQKLAEPGAFLHDLNDFFSRCQDELIEPEDFDLHVHQCEQKFLASHPHLAGPSVGLENPKPQAGMAAPIMAPADGPEWEEIAKRKELARVFRTSRRMIEDSGASSLGSLVSETVALWRRDPSALEEARAQFRAVLVDEFQDTNYAQAELLKLLVPPPYAITAVGDDDQAIYRFRGASHGAFAMFSRAFPGHKTVYLTRNYRSTKHILHAASAVIGHNDRYAEKPALVSSNEEGPRVYLVKAKSPESEAVWIADEVERLARKDTSYGGIAILYRAHNYRDLLVQELRRRGVPISIRGLSILSTTTLRDLCAYLRVIHSPHDNISLTRILLAPRWRVPETLAQSLRERASTNRCSLYDAIKNTASQEIVDGLAGTAWDEVENLLKTFRRLARSIPMTALLDRLMKRLDWRRIPGDPDRIYLEAFSQFLNAWEEKNETKLLAEFIEYFNYFIEAGGKIEAPQAAANAVQMMTMHAAKGLEFPVVFVIGVSPRRFPATERKPVIEFPAELRKGPPPPQDIHRQEERRLFFVGLTRAEQRLYVSSVSKSERQQSVFIQDLLSDPSVRARDLEIIEAPETQAIADPLVAADKPAGKILHSEKSPGTRGLLFGDGAPIEGGFHASLAAWAAQNPTTEVEGDLHLSATAVEDYLACPLKYKFQHLLKIPTAPQAALTFGNLMHRSVRHYFELRRQCQPGDGDSATMPAPLAALPTAEQVQQFYLDNWKSVGFDDEYQEETYRKAGRDQLRGFVEKQNTIGMDARTIEMEQSFQLALGDITLDGRIDQINRLGPSGANGQGSSVVELVDYKTGRPRTEKGAEKSLQLSVYALAAKAVFGLNAARLTLYNLTNNEAVSSVRTADNLNRAVEDILGVAASIRSGQFDATPGFICRWCNYVPICSAHED
ncbi:MAG: ATP-dependent helicase [Terriglobia bacterium]